MLRFLTVILLASALCGCYYGQRNGVLQTSDQSYLHFVGNTEGAKVVIDEKTSFVLGTEEKGRFQPQQLYMIQSGKHAVKIFRSDTLVFNHLTYIGNNETKEINIP